MKLLPCIFAIIIGNSAIAQGFVNLGFESANPSGYPPGSDNVPTSALLPGWTAYYGSQTGGTNPTTQVWYDSLSLGGAMIAVNDTNFGFGFIPYQGNYTLVLEGSSAGPATLSAVGQTGQIPPNTQSLVFFVAPSSGFQVSFAGQLIPLAQIGSGVNYDTIAGNISSFAGQTGQLLFTALANNGGYLDNIQFSNQPIPEPSELALVVMGASFLGLRRWRKPLP